jgi:FAD:protein FMN transferase
MKPLSRRRFLTIAGTALGASLLPCAGFADPSLQKISWFGTALGAQASLTLYHLERAYAEQVITLCMAEILRLEKIFSLFHRSSSLVQLNNQGHLINPPSELIDVLEQASLISKLSHGAFDVSVQPLWVLFAGHFQQANAEPNGPSQSAIAKAKDLVGWQNIVIAPNEIKLLKKGMALTLNGIAQGYITDRVSELLKAKGFKDILVNMGEFRALGHHPDGSPWRIQLGTNQDARSIALDNQAIATSAAQGTYFDRTGRYHHLFDPRNARPAENFQHVSVCAPTATLADALSTTLVITNDTSLLEHFPNTKAYVLSI